MGSNERVHAKKVLFLYPHSVIQDHLIGILIQAEFEVGLIRDHQKSTSLLFKYPSSILFVNIEAELKEEQWEQFIRSVVATREKTDARVGILSYNPDPELARKYLMDIGVQCGYIGLKLGLTESAKIILKTLEANEAKGDRRYIRVKCPPGKTGINFNFGGKIVQGDLLDISSAGFACIIPEEIRNEFPLTDIQLKLWGGIVQVSGKVVGHRNSEDKRRIHVVLFDEDMNREVKAKIYVFIRKALQAEIDAM